jgi:hypothetical protein
MVFVAIILLSVMIAVSILVWNPPEALVCIDCSVLYCAFFLFNTTSEFHQLRIFHSPLIYLLNIHRKLNRRYFFVAE